MLRVAAHEDGSRKGRKGLGSSKGSERKDIPDGLAALDRIRAVSDPGPDSVHREFPGVGGDLGASAVGWLVGFPGVYYSKSTSERWVPDDGRRSPSAGSKE